MFEAIFKHCKWLILRLLFHIAITLFLILSKVNILILSICYSFWLLLLLEVLMKLFGKTFVNLDYQFIQFDDKLIFKIYKFNLIETIFNDWPKKTVVRDASLDIKHIAIGKGITIFFDPFLSCLISL